jgi:hypothetical protein
MSDHPEIPPAGAAMADDDVVVCALCGRDCSQHFWMCDQDERSWCPECWEKTACGGAGVHGEGCPTEVFSTPLAGRGDA